MNSSTAGAAAASPSRSGGTAELSDAAVLAYLKKKGLGSAYLELQTKLESEKKTTTRERLEEEDNISRQQRSLLAKSTGGNAGYDRDSSWPLVQWGLPDKPPIKTTIGVPEARDYAEGFCELQIWVLTLPDDPNGEGFIGSIENPIQRAYKLIQETGNAEVSLKSVMEELIRPSQPSNETGALQMNYPPSVKPELISVTFALLVHTYCELLEVGMESTAQMVRDAFKPIYESTYRTQYRDLYQCETTEDMMRLNSYNSQHMEALNALKNILVQVAGYQLRREELNAQRVLSGNGMDGATKTSNDQKIADCDSKIQKLKQNYTELSHRAGAAFDKMYDLPFLRRARAVRWQLTISTSSYTILSEYLRNENLKSMSTLLQTKCELHVEKRDPVPFIPACLVDGTRYPVDWENVKINWATPLPRSSFETDLPFPKFNLEQEYENQEEADIDKITVEFNRALLMNGFRKLEALERKREYEVLSEQMQKKLKEGDSSLARKLDDPLKPSILLTSLCSNSSGPFFRTKASPSSSFRTNFTDVSAIWEEAGIGMVCAKLCEPDGRRLAVGCDDSAVRIWDATKENNDEPLQVLLGHKNGFPVFDVSWNRDGRALLSCGGDGAVRLWDTMAIGPFGEVAPVKARRRPSSGSNKKGNSGPPEESDVLVPDLKHEKAKYMSGAALAVYRGHAPSSPVWSVSFSPSGYYFASAAADATARLWTTDRPVPVRLFTGHTASNVNCVEWHPNCNYIITGSDDKSARLWDIQTGRTLRLLIGCQGGVNAVKIDPSGRLAAVADVSGTVHLWDLGTGKRVTEFRTKKLENRPTSVAGAPLVHALKFSACGSALATGGDDCCIRVWDVRANSLQGKPQTGLPVKTFSTRQTMIMDLYYTKRNLLLAAGKYVTLVPLAPR